jgi:hypothetical protein
MTVIVCPNDVVDQCAKNIVEIFPDSKVKTGKEAFYAKYNENKHQYLVLNYDNSARKTLQTLSYLLQNKKWILLF